MPVATSSAWWSFESLRVTHNGMVFVAASGQILACLTVSGAKRLLSATLFSHKEMTPWHHPEAQHGTG